MTKKLRNKSPILTSLAAFVATGIQIMPTVPQAPVALNATKQTISKNFKTYSLFLVCNPQWLDPAKTLN